jgi:pimeloyl-ACP methyl ester carboxylesterase
MVEGEDHRERVPTPLEALRVMATQQTMITESLRHVEMYTREGLLSLMWHEPAGNARDVAVVMGGGAMGGVLGPGESLFHVLGDRLSKVGVPALRVGWRAPNDLDSCCLDMAAAVQLAVGSGAEKVVTVGHSFGGAVAVRVAVGLPEMVSGVVTYATQSAGCEVAGGLMGRPLLMFHGDNDSILPPEASEVVRAMAGGGDLRIMHGDDHLLAKSHEVLLAETLAWLEGVFAS